MSIKNWPGGLINDVPPVPSGSYQNSAASGVWTLDQQAYWEKQGLWPTQGSVNPDAFIENLFSTYLYAGNGATQTITNGIDVSGKGGLVWIKDRTVGYSHSLFDTARGVTNRLLTNGTGEEISYPTSVTAFNNNGFTTGSFSNTNSSGSNLVSWTFRKQAKFFDIATYTTVSGAMTIPHNLGSVPGCWIIKSTSVGSAAPDWWFYHRSIPGQLLRLNGTGAVESGFSTATSTNITISAGVFTPGETLVIYLYAHDAGGFGLSGSDNVISCGSYTVSTLAQITLGYEPQLLLARKTSGTGSQWYLLDSMRGFSLTDSAYLRPNVSSIESSSGAPGFFSPTATGFIDNNQVFTNGDNVIYIAIRRGPMAVPTLGTSVFNTNLSSAATGAAITTNFPVDLQINRYNPSGTNGNRVFDRLRGVVTNTNLSGDSQLLVTNATDVESTQASYTLNWNNTGFQMPAGISGGSNVFWNFRRAPSFFDEVCYTGTGSATTVAHNLAAVPELIICKQRNTANSWYVYATPLGASKGIALNGAFAAFASTGVSALWNETTPTSTVFSLGQNTSVNASGGTFVAYLFATCAGVSKVGSYTGTGTTQAINCGFTAGARFVLIKRTDSTGDWYVWDSARGIVAGDDPYLLLNSTAAEVTGTDYVDTSAAGFEITSTAPAAINAVGGSYIFLAIS